MRNFVFIAFFMISCRSTPPENLGVQSRVYLYAPTNLTAYQVFRKNLKRVLSAPFNKRGDDYRN